MQPRGKSSRGKWITLAVLTVIAMTMYVAIMVKIALYGP